MTKIILTTGKNVYNVSEALLRSNGPTKFTIECEFNELFNLLDIKHWGVNEYFADVYTLKGHRIDDSDMYRLLSIKEKTDDDNPHVLYD